MNIVFRPAVRQAERLIIGLGGGTGSGKTYSALLLATGLAGRDGKIAVVDTERGRAEQYAPVDGAAPDFVKTFSFACVHLEPPYSPARYAEHMIAASEHVGEGGVVIIDSMSHEWEGPGGLCEQADELANSMAARYNKSPDTYTFPSWRKPKEDHQKLFVGKLLQLRCHFILCFRAKEKTKMLEKKGSDGKIRKEPTPVGLLPITEEGLPYEMSFFALLRAKSPGVPEFSLKALALPFHGIFKDGERLSEELGKRLRAYSGKAAEARPDAEPDGLDTKYLIQTAKTAYKDRGLDGLKEYVAALSPPAQKVVRGRSAEVMAD